MNTDHGLGLALDLMVVNRSPIGRTIAEWVMNNHASLSVKYVIWGFVHPSELLEEGNV